jgi:hypothetical protein
MPERYLSLANTSSRYWIRAISAQPLDRGNRPATAVREVAVVAARCRTRGGVYGVARHNVVQNRKVPETLGSDYRMRLEFLAKLIEDNR